MKILVTGGAGFIGSHLVDKLVSKNYKIVVLDNLSTGDKRNLNPGVKFYKIDILSPKISEIFQKEKPEIVFHLAAKIDVRKSVENPILNAKTNILGSLNILENCVKNKVQKIVFSSTGGAIYGDPKIIPTPEIENPNPISPYGIEKLTLEKYLNYYFKVFSLNYVALRFANVYGPRQNPKNEAGVVSIFINNILENKQSFIFGDGRQTRDFVYVLDICDALILAMKSKRIGVYNVGTGIETSINELYKKIQKIFNSKIPPKYLPPQPGEVKRNCLNISKIKKELDWNPKYNLKDGISEIKNYLK
jgi:UDP-glucose 4-epimerase